MGPIFRWLNGRSSVDFTEGCGSLYQFYTGITVYTSCSNDACSYHEDKWRPLFVSMVNSQPPKLCKIHFLSPCAKCKSRGKRTHLYKQKSTGSLHPLTPACYSSLKPAGILGCFIFAALSTRPHHAMQTRMWVGDLLDYVDFPNLSQLQNHLCYIIFFLLIHWESSPWLIVLRWSDFYSLSRAV